MNYPNLWTRFFPALLTPLYLVMILAQLCYSQEKTVSRHIIQIDQRNVSLSDSSDANWDGRFGNNNRLYDLVSAIMVVGDEIFVGGPFFKHIARWDGENWSTLGEGMEQSSYVAALAVIGDDLYVGGKFTMVDGIHANNIARWNLTTKKWSALESDGQIGVDAMVRALAAHGNELYAGGDFTTAGKVNANHIAKWNPSTDTWASLGSGVDGSIYAIALGAGEVYAGGTFSSADSLPANRIAQWDGKEWSALGSGVNSSVRALALCGNDLYAGGGFTRAGNVDVNYIATYNLITNSWAPLLDETGKDNGVRNSRAAIAFVSAIGAVGSAIYIGGDFDTAGGQLAENVARWNPDNRNWSPLGSGVNGQVFSILAKDDKVYVGGGFRYAGGKPSMRFAIWHEPSPESNSAPLITSSLPQITFKEDSTLLYPRSKWFNRVQDREDADSLLVFSVLPGKRVTATRQGNYYRFTAPSNWFGPDQLTLIVSDRGQLADTAEFVVRVRAVNDAPVFNGLPATAKLKTAETLELPLWEFVSDVDHPDSTLHFSFSASNDSLRREFNHKTGRLTLTAPDFHGIVDLFVTVQDDSGVTARDTVAVHVDQTTGVVEQEIEIPTEFALLQNYPNPFNPATVIRFALPQTAEVRLEVYDLAGRRVALLLNERKPAGYHQIEFRAAELPSAVYFYRLSAAGFTAIKKLMLLQ